MMGFAQFDLSVPVTKGTNAVTILGHKNRFAAANPHCIRCGKCLEACPMHLEPLRMYRAAMSADLEEMKALSLLDCMECGCCAYNCPATIPLVQAFRAGKQRLRDAAPKKV
jgi:electron transport complex protein RnfC